MSRILETRFAVSKILETSIVQRWKHLSSAENSADLISRGIDASQLHDSPIWWHEPEFSVNKDILYNEIIELPVDLPEVQTPNISLLVTTLFTFKKK